MTNISASCTKFQEGTGSITLTETAALHVKQFIVKRGKGLGIRLGVKTSGCSGFAYKLEAVDQALDDDTCFESHDVKIFVDAKSLVFLKGTELDYVKGELSEGFKFNNPNVKNECGCGESFGV